MYTKPFTTLLLAAGLAACKPINNPLVLRGLGARQNAMIQPATCASPGSNIITALTALETRAQSEVTQMKADDLLFVNISVNERDDVGDGRMASKVQDREKAVADAVRKKTEDEAAKQQLLLGVNQALLADPKANAAINEMDNVLRAVAVTQQEPEKSIVILVVQEIKVSVELEIQVENERKEIRKVDTSVFKQDIVVANRGKQETETVLIYNPRTLTAADIAAQPVATNTANATVPEEASVTQDVAAVVYDAKPTHSKILDDPAAPMRAALEAILEDRQDAARRAEDLELSIKIAVEIKADVDNKDERDRNNRKGEDRNGDRDRENQEREREREREQKKQKEAEEREQDQDREKEKQREDEQRKQKEDEQRKQQEDEQRKQQEDEQRKQQEDEQRKQQEDEQRKQQEDEQRKQDQKKAEAGAQEKQKQEQQQKAQNEAEQKADADADAKAEQKDAERNESAEKADKR